MLVTEFDYQLPKSQIAQRPELVRDQSRFLVLSRETGAVSHKRFSEFPTLLREGDVLVLNDTRVIPARLRGKKETGGAIEVLLDRPLEPSWTENGYFCQRWSCLVHSSRPLRAGGRVFLDQGGELTGDGFVSEPREPKVLLRFLEPVDEYLNRNGEVPLPAYIHRESSDSSMDQIDRERYQSVYARKPGAVAAPTAGLHFTHDLLDRIAGLGVEVVFVTLHVGPGTFLPVRSQYIDQHQMHFERFHIDVKTSRAVVRARSRGKRVVAVGTTVVRTLESAWDNGVLRQGGGETNLFIRPGYRFQVTDALLTNFHLPRSTLLMLVCAFGGMARVLAAYREAVSQGYRFYSYGDAIFLT